MAVSPSRVFPREIIDSQQGNDVVNTTAAEPLYLVLPRRALLPTQPLLFTCASLSLVFFFSLLYVYTFCFALFAPALSRLCAPGLSNHLYMYMYALGTPMSPLTA